MFLVIAAARLKNLRGAGKGEGTRWAICMLALFPACFLLGFVHPLLWAVATLFLEAYIIRTAVRELSLRNAAIRKHKEEGVRLARAADAGAAL